MSLDEMSIIPGPDLTPLNLVKRNIRNDRQMWLTAMMCIAICVFIQSLFFGISSGINTEAEINPQNLDNPVNLVDAVTGWSWLIFVVIAIMVGITVITTIINTISERRKTIGILRSIGIKRKQILNLILAESMTIGILAYLIGSLSAIIIGLLWKLNYEGGNVFGVLSTPFSYTHWILLPLLLILVSVAVSSLISIGLLWKAPVEEVLRYG